MNNNKLLNCPPPRKRSHSLGFKVFGFNFSGNEKGFTPLVKAFTLAEVLVTLTILGILASIIVPSVQNRLFEKDSITKAKRIYSQVANAWDNHKAINSCDNINSCFASYPLEYNVEEVLHPIIADSIGYSQFACVDNFWQDKNLPWYGKAGSNERKVSNLTNTDSTNISAIVTTGKGGCSYLLKNGAVLNIGGTGQFSTSNRVAHFMIDTNGGKKGPNRVGKDVFFFSLTPLYDISPEFAMHDWTTPGFSMEQCYLKYEGTNTGTNKFTCAGKNGSFPNVPERHPLKYVLQHNKLPDVSKL